MMKKETFLSGPFPPIDNLKTHTAIEVFKRKKIEGRKELLGRILNAFELCKPFAIHLFGSGAEGFRDEFSDIDIWITFQDDEIQEKLKKLNGVFKNIAPVVVKRSSKSASPVGGKAISIIHETKSGLFRVDYYVSKLSETVIPEKSQVLYGNDSLKRGTWRLTKDINPNIHDSHTLRKDIDLLLDFIFISVKGIVRKWEGDDFVNIMKKVHKEFRERYGQDIKRRIIKLNFQSMLRLLSDLYPISNERQKKAIDKMEKYIQEVKDLYS